MPLDKWERKHLIDTAKYEAQIQKLYDKAIREAARLTPALDEPDVDVTIDLKDYPIIKDRVDKLTEELQQGVETSIVNGVDAQWTLANNKNSALADVVFGSAKLALTKEQAKRYYSNNYKALEAFKARKTAGLSLSDRVWRYSQEFKGEIEMGLALGIREGVSAAKMATDLQQYLQHPDKLFRRVRDEFGDLQLSQAAQAFHSGQGVYRSSYMNARRLAATETNIAYRTSDYMRYQQFDFVVGIKIELSNNHNCKGVPQGMFFDICDELQGEYPKDFKFTGWHPHCRCHVVTILKTDEELDRDNERIMNGEEPLEGSKNEVKDVPKAYKEWLDNNAERIDRAKNQPYFIKDNTQYSDVKGIEQNQTNVPKTKKSKEKVDFEENIKGFADKIGADVGEPMTFEDANERRSNPHYEQGSKSEYTINCQSCVVANELRRRGLDVEAFGNTKRKGNAPYELSHKTEKAWIDPVTKTTPKKIYVYSSASDAAIWPAAGKAEIEMKYEEARARINEITKENGRYHIDWAWKKGSSGHIVTLERLEDGALRMYDPQNGKIMALDNNFFSDIKLGSLRLLRVDTLHINNDFVDKIVAKAGTTKMPKKTKQDVIWSNWQRAFNKYKKAGYSDDEIYKEFLKYNLKEDVELFKQYRLDRKSRGLNGIEESQHIEKKRISSKDKYGGNDGRLHNNVFKDEKSGGYVVEEKSRREEAQKSKQSMEVYKKEQETAITLAKNGHSVIHLDDRSLRDGSYDAIVDGKKADFKVVQSNKPIEKRAFDAINKQKAEIVVFSVPVIDNGTIAELHKITNKGIHGLCICRSTGRIVEY